MNVSLLLQYFPLMSGSLSREDLHSGYNVLIACNKQLSSFKYRSLQLLFYHSPGGTLGQQCSQGDTCCFFCINTLASLIINCSQWDAKDSPKLQEEHQLQCSSFQQWVCLTPKFSRRKQIFLLLKNYGKKIWSTTHAFTVLQSVDWNYSVTTFASFTTISLLLFRVRQCANVTSYARNIFWGCRERGLHWLMSTAKTL